MLDYHFSFPFELPTNLSFCARIVTMPLSIFPVWFPMVSFIPIHICFIPLSNLLLYFSLRLPYSLGFLLQCLFHFLSSFILLLPSYRSFTRYSSRVGLSPSSPNLFYFLIPPFDCSFAYDQLFPYDLTRCVLLQLLPFSYNLRSCPISLHFGINGTYMRSNNSEISTVFLAIYS